MSKTLFLFQEEEFTPKFFELDGDYSHLHKTYINGSYNGPEYPQISADAHAAAVAKFEQNQEELSKLIYSPTDDPMIGFDPQGRLNITFLDKPTKDWDYFVECGFLP